MALGLLCCQGDPCELSKTLLDIITFNSPKPQHQRIAYDNAALRDMIELIFICGITGMAQNMKSFLSQRHNLDATYLLEQKKVQNALKMMYCSEREPLGFINRLFAGEKSLDYYEILDRLQNEHNQYIFCDHDIFQKFIGALANRSLDAIAAESDNILSPDKFKKDEP